MSISKETVEHYAKLANLRFSEAETEMLARQMGTILQHVDKLSELDLEGVPATANILQLETAFREDEVRPSRGQDWAMQNAPDKESGYFLVPKVIARVDS